MLNVTRPAPNAELRTAQAGGRDRRPVVERIACWSARHRKAVVIGWLLFVAAAFVAGQMMGTQSRPQYDPGQAGQAEQMMHALGVTTPPSESVLIQAKAAGVTFKHDPELRQAAQAVVTAMPSAGRT